MAVIVVGLNQRTVPLTVLETMTVLPSDLAKALHDLASRDHLDEVAVLSTCMRTEVYAVASRYHGAIGDIRNFLAAWSGLPPEAFSDHVYAYHEDAAVTHLFKVAAGLDSAVLGEGEILGQVKTAWDGASARRTAGPTLQGLFRRAVETGKRVRTETAIARGTTSLSQAAVELAGHRLGGLDGRHALVVGAGEMGESVARALAEVPSLASLAIINRTPSRARTLAAAYGGRAVRWSEREAALAAADVLITSTGSQDLLFGPDHFAPALARREGRELLVVDMAVPRDVDPAVAQLEGVTLLDMDDLEAFAEASMVERRKQMPAAEQILAAEVDRYLELAAQREVAPLVAALHERAEEIRQAELARLSGRLGGLDARQTRALEALTRGIVAKLLHDPTVNLKAAAGSARGETLAQAVRQLFDV